MSDFLIIDLDDTIRKKYQGTIHRYITKHKNEEQIQIKEENMNLLLNKLNENKMKRSACLEEYKHKHLNEKVFEQKMNNYEYEGYIFELEKDLLQKELIIKNDFLKRLSCLFLILKFPKGQEKIILSTNNKNKIIYLKDMFEFFLKSVLDEMREYLLTEQKIIQLYILINMRYEISDKDKFYINHTEKENLSEQLILIRATLDEIEKQYPKVPDIDYESLYFQRLLEEDIVSVYNYIFVDKGIKKIL